MPVAAMEEKMCIRDRAEIMSKMVEYKIEPKRMRLVYPYIDKEPNMVLIEGLRGGKSRVTVEKPLIVYKEQGVYTDEIYDIYGWRQARITHCQSNMPQNS